jgi:hypothetical protein
MTEDELRALMQPFAGMPAGTLKLLLAASAEKSILNPGQALQFMMGVSVTWSSDHDLVCGHMRSEQITAADNHLAQIGHAMDMYRIFKQEMRNGKHTTGSAMYALGFIVYSMVNDFLAAHPLDEKDIKSLMREGLRRIMDDTPVRPVVVEE